MKIIEMIYQSRRDFKAVFECEHCKNTEILKGYDDNYFHEKVVPNMQCKKCGQKSLADYVPNMTKYPDGMQV